MGAPSTYTDDIASGICERIAEGESLRSICRDEDTPALRTVMKWLSDGNHEPFVQQYVRAREAQADRMAEDILAIADEGINDKSKDDNGREIVNHDVIARSRLRVDARKWLASKMAPKKYGERLELAGEVNTNTLTDDQIDAKLSALMAKQKSAE